MKTKKRYLLILIFGLTLAGSSFSNAYGQTPKKTVIKTETKTSAVKYTCPMHPDVIMDKPGKCPECGMTLAVKKEIKKDKTDTSKTKHTKEMTGMKM
ncbi:MAG: heavy metal-binding domain-containing protein [Paludibacteraceae bacterium]